MAGKPTPVFYIAVLLLIAALVGFAFYQAGDILAPGGNEAATGAAASTDSDLDINDLDWCGVS